MIGIIALPAAVVLAGVFSQNGRRFIAGHPMDGRHRTNATFFRHPTRALDARSDRSRWHWRPGWHRSAVRLGALALAFPLAAGLLLARGTTLACLLACAAVITAAVLVRLCVTVRRWRRACTWDREHPWKSAWSALTLPAHHYLHFHRPLRLALAHELGVPPRRLRVALDRSRLSIRLPHEVTGSGIAREGITRAVTAKLALESPEPDWGKLHGRSPRVTFVQSQPPPGLLRWEDLAGHIGRARADELVTGMGRRDQLVSVSTQLDSPHFMLAMGSGGGKSNTAAFWLVQRLRRGAIALILDAKYFSHPWAFKDSNAEYGQLPNIAYARTTQDLHNAMVWLGIELQRRTEEADRAVSAKGEILPGRGDIGPELWIVAEEMNLATPRLKQFWADIRTPAQPKRSPALDGMGAVAFAGRGVDMHLIVIGQMVTAASLGGGDVRENMGVRGLARYTANSWKMQAGDQPMPPPSSVPGRIQVVASGTVREAQVPLMDLEQVRELAVGGIVTRCPLDMPGIAPELAVPVRASVIQAADQGIVPSQPRLLTIREAMDEGIFGDRTFAAVKKMLQRAKVAAAGKSGTASTYRLSDLLKVAAGRKS